MDYTEESTSQRPKRLSVKKSSKFELLKKIREAKAKGERFVVESDEKPVYETVDESTYAKIVQERLEDDWIVDDEGLGYADDGREIFDDHDGDAEDEPSSKRGRKPVAKKRQNPDIRASANPNSSLQTAANKDIRNMFAAGTQSQKSFKNLGKSNDINGQDAALDDLLAELEVKGSKKRYSCSSPSIKKIKVEEKPKKKPVSDRRDIEESVSVPTKKLKSKPNPYSCAKNTSEPLKNPAKPLESIRQPSIITKTEEYYTLVDDASSATSACMDLVTLTDDALKIDNKDITSLTGAAWLAEEGDTFTEIGTSVEMALTLDNDKKTLHFFWFDAYEDAKNQPGVVFLFGKIHSIEDPSGFVSCCIRVKDLERRVFFMPRPPEDDIEIGVKEVYQELRELSGQWKIAKFKCKPSTKKYAFGLPDVPSETEYLEVRYSANYPAFPSDLTGKSFSRIFGATTSFLENLILDLHLRGPCWLNLKGAVPLTPQLSWCKVDYDFSFQQPNSMVKLSDELITRVSADGGKTKFNLPPPPPLRLVALDIKSVVRQGSNSSEIISVGILIDNYCYLDRLTGTKSFQSHYLVLAPPRGTVLPYDLPRKLPTWGAQYQPPKFTAISTVGVKETAFSGGVDVEPNERALLGRLLTRIHRLDPDLIVGHDLWGHQLDLLVHRLNAYKIAHWHRIGRLRRSATFAMNFNRTWFMRNALPGRLVCDSRISSRELIRSRTYNLSELAHQVLPPAPSSVKVDGIQPHRQIPASVRSQFSQSAIGLSADTLSGMDLEVDSADLRCLFSSSVQVKELIDFCLSDALLVLRLVHQLQALPLASQITSICGNVLSRTLAGGRSERNEALLLHAFHEHGYMVPDPLNVAGSGRSRGAAANYRSPTDDIGNAGGEEDEIGHSGGRRKPTYTGGLVLEPKRGFYDSYILLLDFNSLYPSIIQEFNLCFTTMDRSFFVTESGKDENANQTEDGQDILISALIASVTSGGCSSELQSQHQRLPTSQSPGILPLELKRLVESRREVKKLISAAGDSDPIKTAQWNIRQMALKITANSVYGCLGFAASRFCARGLAALVTGLGRALLINTRDLVEAMNLEVVYGDTDSIMVNTNSKDLLSALAIGEKVKHEVNKRYRLVELDTDGVFAAMLLLAKKKYAALSIVNPFGYAEQLRAIQGSGSTAPPPLPTKAELKGLDIVRRDWCHLAAEVGRFCVDALLSGKVSEQVLEQIHSYLRTVAERVHNGSLPLSDFVITKMLTKNPEDYPEAKSQPHVQVAQRFNSTANGDGSGQVATGCHSKSRRFRAGDTVEYVVCDDGSKRSAVQRAYSLAEVSGTTRLNRHEADNEVEDRGPQPALKIDVHYYLANQIHPVVSRLVAPIEGTSPAHIADCLGLDSASYRRTMAASAGDGGLQEIADGDGGGSFFSGSFLSEADPLTVLCPRRTETGCLGVASLRMPPFQHAGFCTWVCPTCNEGLLRNGVHATRAVNQLILQARRYVVDYERGWLVCEDPACGLVTRNPSCPPTGGDTRSSVSLWSPAGRPLCPACSGQSALRQRFSESQLYRQLIFFRHLLDPSTTKTNSADGPANLAAGVSSALNAGHRHICRLLSHSAFAMVDLGEIFAGLQLRLSAPPVAAA